MKTKEFFESKKWRVTVWIAAALLTLWLILWFLGTVCFISSWPYKIMQLLWPFAAWYALWLFRRHGNPGKLRKAFVVAAAIALALATVALVFIALISMFSVRRPAGYVTSPGGKHTAVIMGFHAIDSNYSVFPLRARVLYCGGEGVYCGEGQPPEAEAFTWIDEDTLQFADGGGETRTVRF